MNIHAAIDARAYDSRMWWAIVAGCVARFTAERDLGAAAAGIAFWVAVFLVCWIARRWSGVQGGSSPGLEKVANVIALAGLCVFLLRLTNDQLVPALLGFLLSIQAALFLTATKRLHVWLNLAASLACILFAAAESRSGWFLIGAAWFTFAAFGLLVLDQSLERGGAMLARAAQQPSRRTGGAAFACIALAICVPLYLFLPKPAGLLLGGMAASSAHDYRPAEYKQDRPTAAGNDGGAQTVQTRKSAADAETEPSPARPERGDYGNDFSPGDVQRDRGTANDIVMYVKSSRQVYLRGNVYDRFENSRWHRDPHASQELQLMRGNVDLGTVYGPDATAQTIELAADTPATVWHAPGAYRLRFPGPVLYREADGVIVAPRALRAQTQYSVESRSAFIDGRYALLEAQRQDIDRYLRTEGASEPLRRLAHEIAVASRSSFEKAIALEAHLRKNYQYTYETVPQQGYTPLDTFLFETRRGHCEIFASALAMMLRTVDVPSRVVTGFSLGEANPLTGYHEVRQLDGHAWVEAYVDGAWLMLEPTPFYPLPSASEESQVAAQMDRYLERLAETSALLDPDSLSTSAMQAVRDTWSRLRHVTRVSLDQVRRLGWQSVAWILAAAVSLSGAYIALLAAADAFDNSDVRRKLARARELEPGARIRLITDALHAAGTQRGFTRAPGATFREYATAFADLPIPGAFVDGFEAVRYSTEKISVDVSALAQVEALILRRIAADPWPRCRRALASVIRAMQSLLGLPAALKTS
jgi:transglutaminase-like putative cysteine protease